jgi:hypothetical protein
MESLIEKAADLIASERTSDEIAAALNVTIPTVREWRGRADVRAHVARKKYINAERLHDILARVLSEIQERRGNAARVLAELAAEPDMKPAIRRQAQAALRRQNRPSGRTNPSGRVTVPK